MPDLFHGDPIPLNRPAGFDFKAWLTGHLPPVVDPVVDSVLNEMRASLGCEKIGAVGYCFGVCIEFVVPINQFPQSPVETTVPKEKNLAHPHNRRNMLSVF